ncbi:MAG: hypothetical protein EP329_20430 [Deltaproteobacteria bacterium]|nr:MAG: hypothetical protein EP329_20430 [Deltaproteobacteria bacterium]
MERVLESYVRIDRSVIWRLHDAWWASRGLDAFALGGVPSLATSNGVAAEDRAAFYFDLVRHLTARGVLDPEGPVAVLELGAGHGRFAANFLRALEERGPDGRALVARTRYHLTDGARRVVDEAAAGPRLADYVARGVVRPAVLDLAASADPAVDGPLALVLANYVASVLPSIHLQRHADGSHHVLMVRARTHTAAATTLDEVVVDSRWAPTELAECFDDPRHAVVVRRTIGRRAEATLVYPARFLDGLRRLAPRLAPGGAFVVTDCGHTDDRAISGRFTRDVGRYGGSLAEGLFYPVFDAFAGVFGWDAERTDEPLDPLHTVVLAPGGLDEATRAAFLAHLAERRVMTLMDARAAAAYAYDDGEHRLALRTYLRCVELDPHEPEHRYRVGLAAIAEEDYAFAIHHLLVGREEDVERRWDIAFELGRAYALAGDAEAALEWYRTSLVEAPHAVTWDNLAELLVELGRDDEAREAIRAARALREAEGG